MVLTPRDNHKYENIAILYNYANYYLATSIFEYFSGGGWYIHPLIPTMRLGSSKSVLEICEFLFYTDRTPKFGRFLVDKKIHHAADSIPV